MLESNGNRILVHGRGNSFYRTVTHVTSNQFLQPNTTSDDLPNAWDMPQLTDDSGVKSV